MSARRVLIIDTETTSLIPDYASGTGVIWELAIVERATGAEHVWRMSPDLSIADPQALQVGRFYERTEGTLTFSFPAAWDLASPELQGQSPYWSHPRLLAATSARLLDNAILVAANPAFDAAFLAAFLRHHGQAPTWHYRLRDIGSMAYGYLCRVATEPPAIDASTDVMAEALGVDPGQFERHSALGDCRLVNAMMRVIEGGQL